MKILVLIIMTMLCLDAFAWGKKSRRSSFRSKRKSSSFRRSYSKPKRVFKVRKKKNKVVKTTTVITHRENSGSAISNVLTAGAGVVGGVMLYNALTKDKGINAECPKDTKKVFISSSEFECREKDYVSF